MLADSLGNPVTLRDAISLGRVDDFVQGCIRGMTTQPPQCKSSPAPG